MTYVAELNGLVVGYATFDLKRSWLSSIFIAPDYEHRGKGMILKGEGLFRSMNLFHIGLYARFNAVDFYKKLGFKEIGDFVWKIKDQDVLCKEMRISLR